MEVKLNVDDIVKAIKTMTDKEKIELARVLRKDEIIMETMNEYYYSILKARENIIKKREATLNKYIKRFGRIK